MSDRSNTKVQSTLPDYYYWAVERLIGLRGNNHGDVGSYILKRWIDENEKELQKLGISAVAWKKEKDRSANVFEMNEKTKA